MHHHVVRALLVGLYLMKPLTSLAAPTPKAPVAAPAEVVIDAIVASVDEKPITLSDLTSRLSPPRQLSLAEAARDPEALKALETLIQEKILEEEAKTKRLTVADSEVDDYVQEVARRNNLSSSDLQAALAREGKTMASYKQQIKIDILKAKLASTISRGGISTTDSEIDEYIAAHPELKQSGNTIKLHHITISKRDRSPEEVVAKVKSVMESLSGGASFTDVAAQHSDSASGPEGSLLGVVSQSDLSPEVSEIVSPLRSGQHSTPIESASDVRVFYVEQRLGGEQEEDSQDGEEALRNEVRQIIQKQKTQTKLSAYFAEELYKNHAVDKRL